jgi:hypothetical protein
MLALIRDMSGQRRQTLEGVQAHHAGPIRAVGEGVAYRSSRFSGMKSHAYTWLVFNAPQGHRRMQDIMF